MKLTELARKTIEFELEGKNFEPDEITKNKFRTKKASFVTLTKNRELRGCIGSIFPRQELYLDVQENAKNAAFYDPRFNPVEKKELKDIKIEVSVLTDLKKINFKNPEELLKKINTKMGIFLKKGYASATFLPQVWKQIPNKISFLENLSIKANLDKDAWKNSEIFYYFVEVESE